MKSVIVLARIPVLKREGPGVRLDGIRGVFAMVFPFGHICFSQAKYATDCTD
jgi:hypothetical protein